jgi:hypothetical protein
MMGCCKCIEYAVGDSLRGGGPPAGGFDEELIIPYPKTPSYYEMLYRASKLDYLGGAGMYYG